MVVGTKIKVGDTIRIVEKIDGVLCAVSNDHEGRHYSTVEEYLDFVHHCGYEAEIIDNKQNEADFEPAADILLN